MRRSALTLATLLTNGLYASFASAQATLQHIDPVIFVALQLGLSLPLALVILGCTWGTQTRASVRLGLIGGLPLGVGFVCIALALRTLGIIPTAMLTALDGVVASLLSWLVFHQRLSVWTCLAVACAAGGACLLWWLAPQHWQTDLVALTCGVLFTSYAFHVERSAIVQGTLAQHMLPFLGGLFVSMTAVALTLALCFGTWSTLHTLTAPDLGVLLYCGLGTVVVPVVLSTILLRFLSAVTLAFLALLEPLASLGFASVWGSLSLSLVGWLGVGAILLSLLLQVRAASSPPQSITIPARTRTEDEDTLALFFAER